MTNPSQELSKNHPLHEDFDFTAFIQKNEVHVLNLFNDSKKITDNTPEASIIVCSAICSDMTSVSIEDLPLPRPKSEPYLNRFVVFVENMERYFQILISQNKKE